MKGLIKWVLSSASLVISASALGASVIPMSLGEMIDKADAIVVARCVETRSYWQNNKIYTENILNVQDSVKGNVQAEHVVTTLGGIALHPILKKEVKMSVPGGVEFSVGQQALLFTQRNSIAQNQIIGLSQGLFVIEVDEETGVAMIPVGEKVVTNKQDIDFLDLLYSPLAFYDATNIKVRNMSLAELIAKIEEQLN